jgi:hypothetical protein
MKGIYDTLREKEAQIVILQRDVEVLRAAAKIVGNDHRRSASRDGAGLPSQPQMIRKVLLEYGGPLDVDKIAKAIYKRFKISLKRIDITSVIYRAIRGRKLFRKAGINTFSLVEWPARLAGRRRGAVGSRVRDNPNGSNRQTRKRDK